MAVTIEGVLLKFEALQRDVYLMKEAMKWISPIVNKDCGKVAPAAEYLYDGLIAYADGEVTGWKPNGSGAKGLWRYNTTTSLWVLTG